MCFDYIELLNPNEFQPIPPIHPSHTPCYLPIPSPHLPSPTHPFPPQWEAAMWQPEGKP